MACESAETHLLGLGVRLGLYLQGIAFTVIVFRGVLWRSRAIADINVVTFVALVRFQDIPVCPVLALIQGTLCLYVSTSRFSCLETAENIPSCRCHVLVQLDVTQL